MRYTAFNKLFHLDSSLKQRVQTDEIDELFIAFMS